MCGGVVMVVGGGWKRLDGGERVMEGGAREESFHREGVGSCERVEMVC